MDLVHLRSFFTVCRLRSFTKAAEQLRVSQPAVSNHIARLEETLSTRLLDRSAGEITLTASGEMVLERARDILDLVRETEAAVQEVEEGARGRVVLGTDENCLLHTLPPAIAAFCAAHPNVNVSIETETGTDPVTRLKSRHLDLLMGSYRTSEDPALDGQDLFSEELVLASSKGQMPDRLDVARLTDYPLVSPPVSRELRRVVDDFLRRWEVTANTRLELPSLESVRQLVEGGLGPAFLPASMVRHAEAGKKLKEVELTAGDVSIQLTRTIRLSWLKDRYPSGATRSLRELLSGWKWTDGRTGIGC